MIAKVIAYGQGRDEAPKGIARGGGALPDARTVRPRTVVDEQVFVARGWLREPSFARVAKRRHNTPHYASAFRSRRPAGLIDLRESPLGYLRSERSGEWTRWSNNPAHGHAARFGETEVALTSG
jgi:hypothetical protein